MDDNTTGELVSADLRGSAGAAGAAADDRGCGSEPATGRSGAKGGGGDGGEAAAGGTGGGGASV